MSCYYCPKCGARVVYGIDGLDGRLMVGCPGCGEAHPEILSFLSQSTSIKTLRS